jgi:hypothetical protein
MGLLWVGLVGSTFAQPAGYEITPQTGAWFVCVASYTDIRNEHGEVTTTAAELANEFVTTLRRDYRLPGYTFNRGAVERAKEKARTDAIRKQQVDFLTQSGLPLDTKMRVRTVRIDDQYAVMIGGYATMDAARQAQESFKKLPAPKSDRLMDAAYNAPSADAAPQRKGNAKAELVQVQASQVTRLNPFHRAFVVHNPLLPRPQDPDAGKPDPALRELNSGESFSVLRCSKPWTLVVKTFQGACVLQTDSTKESSFGKALGMGKSNSELLSAAGKQAHSLAELLRKMNYDTYVLHTRYQSIVSVGNYAKSDDPQLLQNQQTLANLELRGAFINLLPTPMPMEIPRP